MQNASERRLKRWVALTLCCRTAVDEKKLQDNLRKALAEAQRPTPTEISFAGPDGRNEYLEKYYDTPGRYSGD